MTILIFQMFHGCRLSASIRAMGKNEIGGFLPFLTSKRNCVTLRSSSMMRGCVPLLIGENKVNAQSRTRRNHALWDAKVNDLWGGQLPVLSPEESITAAKKLYRHAMGHTWESERRGRSWKAASGNRYTWPDGGVFIVNPQRIRYGRPVQHSGLRDIIHMISHYCHRRLHPQDKPHSIRQLRLEAKLTKFAIERKWHEGTLRKEPKVADEPEKRDIVVQRYQRMVNRREKWAKEVERAARLLDKAEREVRAYNRRHRERLEAAT